MTAHLASLLNSITLILCSLWGYLQSDLDFFMGFIPAVIGVGLLLCYQGVKKENKIIAHIAVTLTLIVFIALLLRLTSVFGEDNFKQIAPFILMEITTVLALTYFVKSFRDARAAHYEQ